MNIYKAFAFAFMAITIQSCCNGSDCDQSDYSTNIKIYDKVDSTDLFFGNNPSYQLDKTTFFALEDLDTIFFPQGVSMTNLDTSIYVVFVPTMETTFIRYENGDIDTLKVFTKTDDSECCGSITKISEFEFNNSDRIENSFPSVALYK